MVLLSVNCVRVCACVWHWAKHHAVLLLRCVDVVSAVLGHMCYNTWWLLLGPSDVMMTYSQPNRRDFLMVFLCKTLSLTT